MTIESSLKLAAGIIETVSPILQRLPFPAKAKKFSLSMKRDESYKLEELLHKAAEKMKFNNFPKKKENDLRVIVDELITNAFKHGSVSEDDKARLRIEVGLATIMISVTQSKPADLGSILNLHVNKKADLDQFTGRGLFIVNRLSGFTLKHKGKKTVFCYISLAPSAVVGIPVSEKIPGGIVIRIIGKINSDYANLIVRETDYSISDPSIKYLIYDLSQAEFISSGGMNAIFVCLRNIRTNSKVCCLFFGKNEYVKEEFEIVGVSDSEFIAEDWEKVLDFVNKFRASKKSALKPPNPDGSGAVNAEA